MDSIRIGHITNKDAVLLHILELKNLDFYKELSDILSHEVTQSLMHSDAASAEFQALANRNMALVKWLIQLDTEATTELERRASSESEGR